ncbi:MAG: ribokinase [Pseudomonadota bacterium]
MALWTLASINADLVYQVPHLPKPGETLSAAGFERFLGGKGTNMAVAAARAAARVCMIGAVGPDGQWATERLLEYGVDTRYVSQVAVPTGHAIIALDEHAENQIIICSSANRAIPEASIGQALSEAQAGDFVLIQNETNGQEIAAEMGRKLGLRVCYAAAPFDADAVRAVLPFLDFLILNQVEAEQLSDATGLTPPELGVRDVIVTLGANGCDWHDTANAQCHHFEAVKVDAVDTTGAGDTFTGYVLAGLDRGRPMAQAILQATQAAALMVTRRGTADVIPDLKDVQDAMFG